MLCLLQVQLLQLCLWLLQVHRRLWHVHELPCLQLLLLLQAVLHLLELTCLLLHLDRTQHCPAAHAQQAGHGRRPCCWPALLRQARAAVPCERPS